MILIHVIAGKKKDAERIARLLLSKKLLVSAQINPISEYSDTHSKPIAKWELSGRTKALLFNTIQQTLKAHGLGQDLPIHATPIVYMDDWQNEVIRSTTQPN